MDAVYCIFLALFAGFAIKVPLFPFHTWLPLAHVEAPTAGSVLLAGVLLKLGTYGFLRLCLPLLARMRASDSACRSWRRLRSSASSTGRCALAQDDVKKLVAYSSVSHLGFCMLGMFALNAEGITGGVLQMINHGLSTGALFLLVGMIYERYHTRQDARLLAGWPRALPMAGRSSWCSCACRAWDCPASNGFVGEVLVADRHVQGPSDVRRAGGDRHRSRRVVPADDVAACFLRPAERAGHGSPVAERPARASWPP